ncbi:MAG: Clp protease N-terminal domain-containing protein [Dehalococcoidia bacterium]
MTETLDYRTPEWLAEQLDIDKNAVYRYLNEGTLPGLQLGRKWLISESTVRGFLKEEEARQTAERRRMQNDRFAGFTDAAHAALQMSDQIAIQRETNWVGTEHILLALIEQGADAVKVALSRSGPSPEAVKEAVEAVMNNFTPPSGTASAPLGSGLTPRAKKAIELSMKEAEGLGETRVGPEHLLLGMLALNEGIAAELLKSLGVTIEGLRRNVAAVRDEANKAEEKN